MSAVAQINQRGLTFGKYLRALTVAKGDLLAAAAFAEGRGPQWSDVAIHLRGAVAPLSSINSNDLAYPVAQDFAEFLRPQTLVGRMVGLHRVPFNCRLIRVATGGTAGWVGEGTPIPVGALDLDSGETLAFTKIAAVHVVTSELARSSSPSVELVLSRDMAAAAALAADIALTDPTNNGIANVKPASITFGASSIVSSGGTVAAIDADLKFALAVLNDSHVGLDAAYWMLSPKTAVYLSLLRGTAGDLAYPTVTARGGTLAGLPVLTSAALMDESSPTESIIVLAAASEIMIADDGASSVTVSEHAAVEMTDAPQGGAQQLVSFFEHGLVGLMSQRTICWQPRRPGAVAVIGQVQY
jgi:HK97 family phage major capsid protein